MDVLYELLPASPWVLASGAELLGTLMIEIAVDTVERLGGLLIHWVVL